MKKFICCAALISLAAGLLSGCGGEFAEEIAGGRNGVSGQAVSGQAVSGQVVSGQAVSDQKAGADSSFEGYAEKYRFCSDRCLYMEAEEYAELKQVCLRTKEEKVISVKGLDELVFVEKDALYFTRENSSDDGLYYSLWRLPLIAGEKDGEEIDVDAAERVKGLSDIYCETDAIYMDEEFVVYSGCAGDEDTTDVIRYDRARAVKEHMPVSKRVQDYVAGGIWSIVRYGDKLYLDTDGGVVCWDVRRNEAYCVGGDTGNWEHDTAVCGEDAVFDIRILNKGDEISGDLCLLEDLCVKRVDMETKESTDFMTSKEIERVLEEEAGIKRQDMLESWIGELYYYDRCLYIELGIVWNRGGRSYEANYVLSRKDAPGSELQYESALTDLIHENSEVIEESALEATYGYRIPEGRILVGPVLVGGIIKQAYGKLYLSFDYKEKTGNGCYDLRTKKYIPVEKGVTDEYYELYYDGGEGGWDDPS